MRECFDDIDDDDVRESFGCMFPKECIMAGEHFPSECVTGEMMEQMQKDESFA
jgi:hypothetical protein